VPLSGEEGRGLERHKAVRPCTARYPKFDAVHLLDALVNASLGGSKLPSRGSDKRQQSASVTQNQNSRLGFIKLDSLLLGEKARIGILWNRPKKVVMWWRTAEVLYGLPDGAEINFCVTGSQDKRESEKVEPPSTLIRSYSAKSIKKLSNRGLQGKLP